MPSCTQNAKMSFLQKSLVDEEIAGFDALVYDRDGGFVLGLPQCVGLIPGGIIAGNCA